MKLKGDRRTLSRKSAEVTEDCSKFCEDFSKFILSKRCAALSASQVGSFLRIIGIKSKSKKRVKILVNPTIIKASNHYVTKPESCVSLGIRTVEVKRPMWVKVSYYTPDLRKYKSMFFFKRRAAAACHVIDMLDGKLIF